MNTIKFRNNNFTTKVVDYKDIENNYEIINVDHRGNQLIESNYKIPMWYLRELEKEYNIIECTKIKKNDEQVFNDIRLYIDSLKNINGINIFAKYYNKETNNLILFFGDNHTIKTGFGRSSNDVYDHLCSNFQGDKKIYRNGSYPYPKSNDIDKPFISDLLEDLKLMLISDESTIEVNLFCEFMKNTLKNLPNQIYNNTPLVNDLQKYFLNKDLRKYWNPIKVHYTELRTITNILYALHNLFFENDFSIYEYLNLNQFEKPKIQSFFSNFIYYLDRNTNRLYMENISELYFISFTFGIDPQNMSDYYSKYNVRIDNFTYENIMTKYTQYYNANINLNIFEFLKNYYSTKFNYTEQDMELIISKIFINTEFKFITNEFELKGKTIITTRYAKQILKVREDLHKYLVSFIKELLNIDLDIESIELNYESAIIDVYLLSRVLYYSNIRNQNYSESILKNSISIVYAGEGSCDTNYISYNNVVDEIKYLYGTCDIDTYGHISACTSFIRKYMFNETDFKNILPNPPNKNILVNYEVNNDIHSLKKYTRNDNFDCIPLE